MKTFLLLTLSLVVTAASAVAQGAQAVIIKQRAKELRDQNNVRQGVPTPAQPTRPAPATPGQTTANPRQQNIALLLADLAALQGQPAAPELKQRFARHLLAAAQGPAKPAGGTVMTCADHLAGVLASKTLEAADRARLAQDLNAVFDCANLPSTRVDAILADVQAILQVAGARRQEALSVVGDLRAAAHEIQKPPAR